MKPTIYAPFLSLVALAACNNLSSPSNTPLPPSFSVIRAQGDSLTVADTLNKFRAALGGSLNAPNSPPTDSGRRERSEEHTSELQSQSNLVCRLLLEKKNI